MSRTQPHSKACCSETLCSRWDCRLGRISGEKLSRCTCSSKPRTVIRSCSHFLSSTLCSPTRWFFWLIDATASRSLTRKGRSESLFQTRSDRLAGFDKSSPSPHAKPVPGPKPQRLPDGLHFLASAELPMFLRSAIEHENIKEISGGASAVRRWVGWLGRTHPALHSTL